MEYVGERTPAHRVGREAGRGRARRVPGREERDEHQRSARMGLTGAARRRARRGRGHAWRSWVSTRCCCRSAPTSRTSPATRRCRSSGSRCSCSRVTARRCSSCPSSRRHASRRSPGAFELRAWSETEDPIAIVAGLVGARRDASRSVTRPGPASCCGSRTRSPEPRLHAGVGGHRPAAGGEGRAPRSKRCAPPRTRSTRSAAEMRRRPFAGRTELDVHREFADRILEHGHQRVNFAIVGSGPNGASPHHEASSPGDRRRRRGRLRLRRDDGRLLLGHHAHVRRR